MHCKICLKEVEEFFNCEVCGDGGMCEDCAGECAEYDDEEAFD
jgi:hypothetical protein